MSKTKILALAKRHGILVFEPLLMIVWLAYFYAVVTVKING